MARGEILWKNCPIHVYNVGANEDRSPKFNPPMTPGTWYFRPWVAPRCRRSFSAQEPRGYTYSAPTALLFSFKLTAMVFYQQLFGVAKGRCLVHGTHVGVNEDLRLSSTSATIRGIPDIFFKSSNGM